MAKSVSAILVLAFMSTAFVVLPDHAESISWSAPIAIGDGLGGQSESPSSAANRFGQIVVAWCVWQENSSAYVLANRYDPTQGWAGAEALVENDEVQNAAAGIDDYGNCLVVWAQGPSVQSRIYKVGVGWEPVVQVSSSLTSRWFYDVKLAVTPDGAAMVIWCEDNMEAYGPFHAAYKPAGGSWQKPSDFQSTSTEIMNVRLTNDGSGNFVTVFTLYDGMHFGVWANSFAPASGWGNETRIEDQTYNAYDLNIAMNRAGDAVAVWQQFGYPDWNSPTAFANHYSPGNGWGTEVPIEELGSGGCDPPVVSIDESGNAVSIWRRVADDMRSSSLRTNTYTAGAGWGSPATLEHSSDSIDEHVSVGVVGSETFAAWIQVVIIDNVMSGYELIANHYNTTSGWETPSVITDDIASSPSVTADNLGGATIAWFGNATTPNTFVSRYIASATPPRTHEVIKGEQGPKASAVTWEYAPSDYGTWTGRIMNNGLRSLLVDVYDVTTGIPDQIMHERIRFAANDAYPYGEVNTSGVVMSPIHRYMITVTPNGPRGASCVVEDMFLKPQSPPVASFTISPFSGDTATIFTFDASGSWDAETPFSDLQVRWDWDGDGRFDTGWSTDKVAVHIYPVVGQYSPTLEVMDSGGLTNQISTTVSVNKETGPNPHGAIAIYGDDDFTPKNGVTGGSGTQIDPYVIEGWEISSNTVSCIEVRDTRAYFEIRGVSLSSKATDVIGLNFYNVSNGNVLISAVVCSWTGIQMDYCTNIRIVGCSISYGITDVDISHSANIELRDSTMRGDAQGLHFHYSQDFEVVNCSITTGLDVCWISESSRGTLVGNTMTLLEQGGMGLYISSSSSITMYSNHLVNTSVDITGFFSNNYDTHTIAANNTVNGEPLLCLDGASDLVLDRAGYGQVILVHCSYVKISNMTFVNNDAAVIVACSDSVYVRDNIFSSCIIGVRVFGCNNILVVNNSLTRVGQAIGIWDTTYAFVFDNTMAGLGLIYYNTLMPIYRTTNLEVRANTLSDSWDGVMVFLASNAIIHGNLISNMQDHGMYLWWSQDVDVVANTFSQTGFGLDVSTCTRALIYNNDFLGNVIQAQDTTATDNHWDNGYPEGGNYWSDYAGTDANGDGFGDSPYSIPTDGQDRYPLMDPYHKPPPPSPTATYVKLATTNGVKINIVAISRPDVPWDDVSVKLTDGTNLAVWTPYTSDLTGEPTASHNYSVKPLGALTVCCWVTDVSGDGFVSGTDYFRFFTYGGAPTFSSAQTYSAVLVYDPTGETIGMGVVFTG